MKKTETMNATPYLITEIDCDQCTLKLCSHSKRKIRDKKMALTEIAFLSGIAEFSILLQDHLKDGQENHP